MKADDKTTKNKPQETGLASLLGKRESSQSAEKLEQETKALVRNDPEGAYLHKRVVQDEQRASATK